MQYRCHPPRETRSWCGRRSGSLSRYRPVELEALSNVVYGRIGVRGAHNPSLYLSCFVRTPTMPIVLWGGKGQSPSCSARWRIHLRHPSSSQMLAACLLWRDRTGCLMPTISSVTSTFTGTQTENGILKSHILTSVIRFRIEQEAIISVRDPRRALCCTPCYAICHLS
jgi:hypothetical protein